MRIPDSWRLSFPDASLELEYRRAYWHHWVPYARVGLLSAAFLGAAFSLLDHLVVGYAIGALSLIRFCILVPTILIGFLLSFFQATSSRYHWVIIVCVIIVGLCIISMIAIIEPPAADYYYAGLIMVLFFNYTLLQLRLAHAITSGLILVVSYEVLAVCVLDSPSEAIINNTFFPRELWHRAEDFWRRAVQPALDWEMNHPGRFIHKGTPFYFWGMAVML